VLVPLKVLEEVRLGRIDLAFRRWQKPTVKPGGRLRTAVGELTIGAVTVVDPELIPDADAVRAGFASADALRAELFRERKPASGRARTAKPTDASQVYRIEMSYAGEDARIALRTAELSDAELGELVSKVRKLEARSSRGDWVVRTLSLIGAWPARRAPELAEMEGLETLVFKTGVRKLKELGLTESLRVGYRLSPRGERVLAALRNV
jgi:hypothetical protein